MLDSRNARKGGPSRGARREGSKDLDAPHKEHPTSGTFSPETYWSTMD